MWELATRAHDPVVRRLMLETLNLAQTEVARLQATSEAERIRKIIADFDGDDTSTPQATLSMKSKASKVDNSEDPDADDPDDDGTQIDDGRILIAASGISIGAVRKRYKQLTSLAKANFRWDDWLLWQVINTDAEKVFVEEDLQDTAVLERALLLLYLRPLGRSKDLVLGTIHVKYDALTDSAKKAALQKKVELNEKTLTSIIAHIDLNKPVRHDSAYFSDQDDRDGDGEDDEESEHGEDFELGEIGEADDFAHDVQDAGPSSVTESAQTGESVDLDQLLFGSLEESKKEQAQDSTSTPANTDGTQTGQGTDEQNDKARQSFF